MKIADDYYHIIDVMDDEVPTVGRVREKLAPFKTYLKEQYKVKQLWVFGSVSKGESTLESDIDIRVEIGEGGKGIAFWSLWMFLEAALGRKIDLSEKWGRSDESDFVKRIKPDLILVLDALNKLAAA